MTRLSAKLHPESEVTALLQPPSVGVQWNLPVRSSIPTLPQCTIYHPHLLGNPLSLSVTTGNPDLLRLPLTPKPLCAFLLLTLSPNPPYILKPSGPLGLSSTKALTSSNSTLNGSFPFLLQQYLAPFEDMDFAADVDGDGSFLSYNPHTVYWLEDLVFVLHYYSPPSLSRKPLSCHFPVRLCHPWPLLKITCFPLCPYWFSAC